MDVARRPSLFVACSNETSGLGIGNEHGNKGILSLPMHVYASSSVILGQGCERGGDGERD